MDFGTSKVISFFAGGWRRAAPDCAYAEYMPNISPAATVEIASVFVITPGFLFTLPDLIHLLEGTIAPVSHLLPGTA